MAQASSRPPRSAGGSKGTAKTAAKSGGKTSAAGKARKPAAKKPAAKKTASGAGKRKTGKRVKATFTKKWLLLLIICFVLGVSAGGGLFWYFSKSPAPPVESKPSQASAPAKQLYEEPASRELMQVDNAIYNALNKAGVEQSQIKLWVDLGSQGEVSRLEVGLNGQHKLDAVAAGLDRALGATGARAQWQKQENFWHLDVYLDKQLTHQVNLRKDPAPPPTLASKPRVVIIVDDVGLNPEALNQLLGLQMELTYSVLPYAPNAAQVARKITGQGRELWLHLPMEPLGRHNPGPGALYSNMSQAELSRLTQQALDRVPGVVGVNNHMGSKLTQNAAALNGPLQVIKSHNLMFIDSVTSPKSVAATKAKEMGLITGQRDIFLDHEVKEEAIVQQIGKLIRLAKSKGSAIAICHPHAATISALKQTKPLLSQMVELVPASVLLENP